MTLYAFAPGDVADLLELVRSPSLTITANNALRVAQLQALLANAQPSPLEAELERVKHELEVTHGALLATERQRQEWIDKASKYRNELNERELEPRDASEVLEVARRHAADAELMHLEHAADVTERVVNAMREPT